MNRISRRAVLQGSRLAVLAPVAGAFTMQSAFARTSNSIPTVPTNNAPHSRELASWMQESLGSVVAPVRAGQGTSAHWSKASSVVRLYARHLEDTGIDLASNALASTINPSKPDLSKGAGASKVYSIFKKYDPSLKQEDVAQTLRFTSSDLERGAKSLRENGYSWHFYKIADDMQRVSNALQVREANKIRSHAPVVIPASLSLSNGRNTGVARPGMGQPTPPHLQLVGSRICRFMQGIISALGISQEVKDEICDTLSDAGILAALAGVTAEAACDGGVILSILATDGVAATIAGPLETVVCEALGVYSGLTVAAGLATLSCALDC